MWAAGMTSTGADLSAWAAGSDASDGDNCGNESSCGGGGSGGGGCGD